ncbi:hypothetical protein GCM10025772_09960 [Ferrimonas gelatinilytica]|uniref:Uncharacterized protein n=1 Tax=Ferrimonas gelatinilytica TaxID=1255257 RepID=A0ABP9RYP3_9GAMM
MKIIDDGFDREVRKLTKMGRFLGWALEGRRGIEPAHSGVEWVLSLYTVINPPMKKIKPLRGIAVWFNSPKKQRG